MRRLIPAAAIAVLVVACGGPPGGTPIRGSPSPSIPAATPAGDATIVAERAPGVTLKTGDSGTAELQGGRYRIAWYAPGCTMLGLQMAMQSGESVGIDVTLPSGESFVELPAGVGVLNRVADCDYTVRFEELP